MSEQKFLPPPDKVLLIACAPGRRPMLAFNKDKEVMERLSRAGISRIFDGGRVDGPPTFYRAFCKPPKAVKEQGGREAGIPDHLFTASSYFFHAQRNGKNIFCIYYNTERKQLAYSSHITSKDACLESAARKNKGEHLILSFYTSQSMGEQLRNSDKHYISPLHHIDDPIIAPGSLHNPHANEFIDRRNELYMYR